MKYLGIDYGTKRVGIALSDEGGSFAFPYGIVDADKAFSSIIELVNVEGVVGIVMGHSVATNGAENEIATPAGLFRQKLAERVSVPVVFEREDFSTVEAHRYQLERGSRDDSAAAIILQRYLDKRAR
jgi:putative Holliday junction resolvase